MVTSSPAPVGEDAAQATRLPRATHAARTNLAVNLAAVAKTQPRLAEAVGAVAAGAEPVYARDGSLTAFGPDGKWWHNCSVPLRAARAMLAALDVQGRVACLLAPTLAAHVRAALAKARPDQAILVICPDPADLRVMLASDDFSADINAHRLWIAWAAGWAGEMKRLFEERPGLATPAQFVRLPTTPAEEVDRLVNAAQALFSSVNAARARQVAARRDGWSGGGRRSGRLCVVAPSHFRLWNDAGGVLADALASAGADRVVRFDPDDPACSSALALLDACEGCDAVVAADTSRADLPGVVPAAMPWITWVTRAAAIPAFAAAGPSDALLLADEGWRAVAHAAGWPAVRATVAGWPAVHVPTPHPRAAPSLAVVADTRPVVMPDALAEFSSHALLWDAIAAELAADPFALNQPPAAYLQQRMKRHGVSPQGFDAAAFLERLIVPAYEQSVARLLARANLPVRLFGAGWQHCDDLRPLAAGPVLSRADLARIGRSATAVVDVSPAPGGYPVQRLGRPVVAAAAGGRRRLLDAARNALRGGTATPGGAPAITAAQVRSLL